jgi:signal transduction histidine kinase/CheY-like chemotaxis protein
VLHRARVSAALAHRRLEELYAAELRLNERLLLLSQAGDVLSSTLDYEATLQNVARLAIPALGDMAIVNVIEGNDVRFAFSAADASVEGRLREAIGDRVPRRNLMPISPVVTGRPLLAPEVDAAFRSSLPPALRDLYDEIGTCSILSVPLLARDQTLGSLSLCFASSGRRHTQTDLDLAQEIARRASAAIENARLHLASQEAIRRAEEAIRLSEQANRAKDEFLGIVSHELRTPLNAILGWSQLLRGDKIPDPAMVAKGLTVIERNSRAQVKLIEDILDVSRIISGKLRLELRPMDLDHVLRAAVEVIRPAADAKGVDLRVEDGAGATVLGDPDRLQQAVWNLLSNAVKFTPSGGRVAVRLARAGRNARVLVTDSGRGIDTDFLPYVFERFRQADTSTTRRYGGLGLGLAIVRHVVELHGGSVRAESEGEGRGSAFTVKLPLYEGGDHAREIGVRAMRDTDPGAIVRLDGLRVLVVDDEPDAREMLGTMLSSAGAEVELALSAADALGRLSSVAPDVLISDVGMPGDDGYSLIRRVRDGGSRFARVPALALTAYASPEDARRAVLAGFQKHLSKPVEPAMLTAVVAALGARGLRGEA